MLVFLKVSKFQIPLQISLFEIHFPSIPVRGWSDPDVLSVCGGSIMLSNIVPEVFLGLMALRRFIGGNVFEAGLSGSASHAGLLHDLIPLCLYVVSRPRLGSLESTVEMPTRL